MQSLVHMYVSVTASSNPEQYQKALLCSSYPHLHISSTEGASFPAIFPAPMTKVGGQLPESPVQQPSMPGRDPKGQM